MITSKTQVKPINGLMLAAGYKVETQRKKKPTVKVIPPIKSTLKDKDKEGLRIFTNATKDVQLQKKVVLAVSLGFNTVNKAIHMFDGITLVKLQKYFRRVDNDRNLTKFRVKPTDPYLYQVTDKGLAFKDEVS